MIENVDGVLYYETVPQCSYYTLTKNYRKDQSIAREVISTTEMDLGET
jgi:hypothetical protein